MGIVRDGNCPVVIVRDGNCPGWELSGGNCPGWELSGMGIVRWELSGKGTVRDGNCPGWELSTWWELSGMGTVRDGNCPDTGILCLAHGCNQRSGSTEEIRFHTFPHRDEVLLKKWMVAITRESFVPSKHLLCIFVQG